MNHTTKWIMSVIMTTIITNMKRLWIIIKKKKKREMRMKKRMDMNLRDTTKNLDHTLEETMATRMKNQVSPERKRL